mmetsp:Transcript_2996/g.7399  ORF Transcript_2996/g.7399 Transcript_2996/m.7399 type:complete len:489 (-) Transcript_2996:1285-2751(-)
MEEEHMEDPLHEGDMEPVEVDHVVELASSDDDDDVEAASVALDMDARSDVSDEPRALARMEHPVDDDATTVAESDADTVLMFSDDEEDELDTTAEQVVREGRDVQGIPWDRLQFTRDHYRETRLRQYRNYVNVLPEDPAEYRPEVLKGCKPVSRHGHFFDFVRNNRAVHSNIVHFQLRNLVWATSRNDVFLVHDNAVNHWSPATRKTTEVLNLRGRGPGLGRVQISTLCVREGLLAAGGFQGELVVTKLGDTSGGANAVFSGRVTASENGITNGIEVYASPSAGPCVMTSNNDAVVRVFAAQPGFKRIAQFSYPWAVNYATVRPEGHVVAVVGDDPETVVTDLRSGATVHTLRAQADFSFAAAWHPHGNLLATGNQDTTTAVWDIRAPAAPLVKLAGRMGAIRSLRFSPCGRFLAAAEPADFVHVYDVAAGFATSQEADLFGEIAGISFTPRADALFVGVADITYASLLQLDRHTGRGAEGLLAACFA